jgi:hypothetical protein
MPGCAGPTRRTPGCHGQCTSSVANVVVTDTEHGVTKKLPGTF